MKRPKSYIGWSQERIDRARAYQREYWKPYVAQLSPEKAAKRRKRRAEAAQRWRAKQQKPLDRLLRGHVEKRHRATYKEAAVNVYTNGNAACVWCGQADIDVLCLDHVNNDGANHRRTRRTANIYRYVCMNDYPEGFQVLCFNCNIKKEFERRRRARPSN